MGHPIHPEQGTAGLGNVEISADFSRAWEDGKEIKPGTFMVVPILKAVEMGVMPKSRAEAFCTGTMVYICMKGYAVLEAI